MADSAPSQAAEAPSAQAQQTAQATQQLIQAAPAIEQAQNQTIMDFLLTGDTTPAAQYLAGMKDYDTRQISDFITGVMAVPAQAATEAASPDLQRAVVLTGQAAGQRESILSAVAPTPASNSFAGIRAATEKASANPDQSIGGALTNAKDVRQATAEYAFKTAEDISSKADSLFSALETQSAAVNSALSANAKAKNAERDTVLGPEYQDAMRIAANNSVHAHARQAALAQEAEQARQSGHYWEYIKKSAQSQNWSDTVKQADANAQGLFETIQRSIGTVTMKQAGDFDSELSTAQSGLNTLKDQLGYLKERGLMTRESVDAAGKLADAYDALAQGKIKKQEVDQRQQEFTLHMMAGRQGLQQGALAIKGQQISNAAGALQYKSLLQSKTASDSMAKQLGLANGEELKLVIQSMPDTRRAALTDALGEQFVQGKQGLDLPKLLNGKSPEERVGIIQNLKAFNKDPKLNSALTIFDDAQHAGTAKVATLLSMPPDKIRSDRTISKNDKSYYDAYQAAKGDRARQMQIRQDWANSGISTILDDSGFRNKYPDTLGFTQFTAIPPKKLQASGVDPLLQHILPTIKNRQDPVSASMEMQIALRAAGVTDQNRINKEIAGLFRVYNSHLNEAFGAENFGFKPPTSYSYQTDKIPTLHIFSGPERSMQSYDFTDPLTQSKIYTGLLKQNWRQTQPKTAAQAASMDQADARAQLEAQQRAMQASGIR